MKNKVLLIIIFAVVSFTFAFPHIYGIAAYKNNYLALNSSSGSTYSREETYSYAAEVQQILEGHILGDPYIWEYRNGPSPYLNEISSNLLVAALSILGRSVSNGFILSDLLFPPLLVLIIFFSLRKLGNGNNLSLAGGLAVVFTPFLSMLIPRFSSYGTLLTGTTNDPLFFSRTPNPEISSLLLFITFFLSAIILQFPKKNLCYLWALSTIITIYASPFVSSTVILVTILLVPLLIKRIQIKNTITLYLAIIIFSLPLIINYLNFHNFLGNSDFIERSALAVKLYFPSQVRYLLIAFILLFLKKRDSLSYVVVFYIISSSFLVDFHQLLIGKNLQGDHWISRIMAPIATLAVILIINEIFKIFSKKFLNIFWGVISIILILIGLNRQISWINSGTVNEGYNPYQKIILTINRQTLITDVIGTTDSSLNEEIRANTGRWNYYAAGDRTFIPMEEEISRICNLAILTGEKEKANHLLIYALGLQARSEQKVNFYQTKLNSCLSLNKYNPKYKLNYLAIFDKQSQRWNLLYILNTNDFK